MPNAAPSADIALARKSGWVYRIAMLIVGSAFWIVPTRPSGATTGLYRLMPAVLPAVSVSVVTRSSLGAVLCSASAGTKPHSRRVPSPMILRSWSFSSVSACALTARIESESWRELQPLARDPGAAPALGAPLKPDQRRDERTAERAGDGFAIARSEGQSRRGTIRRSRPTGRRRFGHQGVPQLPPAYLRC